MSLATSIKDFSDTLNNLHTTQTSSLPILPFLQEILIFSIKSVTSGIAYVLTFGWFRDIAYLPLLNPTSPQQLEITNAEHLLFPGFTFSSLGDFSFTDSISHFFSFSNTFKSSTNYILSGLINSFFFSLPFSLVHLISIRRLFSQGIQAALASLLGSIAAHSLFLISMFYGLRFLIIPWFSLEPVTYILGFSLNIVIIKELIQTSNKVSSFATQQFQQGSYAGPNTNTTIKINSIENLKNKFFGSPISPQQYKKESQNKINLFLPLLRIGLLSFGLTWCEELNVFSSITHLTLNDQNTYLDLYPSTNAFHSLLVHTLYLLAFILGNCGFSLFFYYLLRKSGSVIGSWTNTSNARINDTINKAVLLLILTFTFASFPYYGLDYLIGKVSGFLPEDPIYKESILSPTKITVNKRNTLFIKADSADKKKQSSLLDINNFDNGVYLNNIDFNKFDNFPSDSKSSITRTISFEKSNYRQENAWIRRNYLARLRARPRKNSDTATTAWFYKAFKDPQAYYQKIQLDSDRKQSKNIREIQGKKPSGYFVQRQEGVLVEEPKSKLQSFWDQPFNLENLPSTSEINTGQKDNGMQEGTLNAKPSFAGTFGTHKNGAFVNQFDPETSIFAERYTKGVKQKSSVPLLKKTRSLSTKNIIKRKFFLNPVYRTLLHTDIDAFISRQPVKHNTAENQDYDLYKKRLILERYYNWLRYYSPLQNDLQDLYNISESKSFVDSVFHHQFKGTLKIAKRLFPITFDPQQNSKRNRVLSYDQTLYKDLKASENPLLHEELALPIDQTARSKDLSQNQMRTKKALAVQEEIDKDKRNLLRSNPSTLSQNNMSLDLQDQAPLKGSVKKPSSDNLPFTNSPFIEESDTSPLYAGWDDTLRRFVVTNRFVVEKQE